MPDELRAYMGLKAACERVARTPGLSLSKALSRGWLCMDLPQQRKRLAPRFPDLPP